PSQSSSPGWMRRLSTRWCAREPVRVMRSPTIASGSMKNTGMSIEHIFHLVQETVARHIQQLAADARILFQQFLLLWCQLGGDLHLHSDQLIAGDVFTKTADPESFNAEDLVVLRARGNLDDHFFALQCGHLDFCP